MKPRPFYRSFPFQAGLFLILAILWFWWDSLKRESYVGVGRWLLRNGSGSVELLRRESSWDPESGRFWHDRAIVIDPITRPIFVKGMGDKAPDPPPIPVGQWTYQQLAITIAEKQAPGSWLLGIPHWLLILIATPTWLALLAWQLLRIILARKTAPEIDP